MKYTLDTNIFVDGFWHEDAQADVLTFLMRALPFTYLSAVVMQELAAGARSDEAAGDVQRGVFDRSNVDDGFLRHRSAHSSRAAAFSRPSLRAKGGNCSTITRRCSTMR